MYQALYRKYRPSTFSDVVGRDTITSILRGQVKAGKTSHAYLFCGNRGTGKTTCAKILAKAVNCLSPINGDPCGKCEACKAVDSGLTLDIVEMDAASNTGVNDVRDIIDSISYMPSELQMRVYIIDEVHMLSTSAFNALLKTLEEPPAHVMFILATTELHKVPATVVSRCQRFDFEKISIPDIVSRISYIAECEGVKCTEEAFFIMAKLAQGSMRDAIGYLELCSGSGSELNEKSVSELLGVTVYDVLLSVADGCARHDYSAVFKSAGEVFKQSDDPTVLWFDLISLFRDMLVIKTTDSDKYVNITPAQYAKLSSTSVRYSVEKIVAVIGVMNEAVYLMQRNPTQKRIIAEMALLKLCDDRLNKDYDAFNARLTAVEDSIASITAGGYKVSQPAVHHTDIPVTDNHNDAPEKAESAPIVNTPEKPAEERKAMKLCRVFADVCAKLKAIDPSSVSYISDSTAYECEDTGEFIIIFNNSFSKSVAQRNKDNIEAAVISVFHDKYTGGKIVLQSKEFKDKYRLIDDVIEAAEEK